MKKTKKLPTLLFFIATLVSSCTVGINTPTATLQAVSIPTATATPIATMTVELIPIQENIQDFSAASQWKNTFESLFGKLYRYREDDISPDGHWVVKFDDKTLQLIDVNNPAKPIEYRVSGDDILLIYGKSWATDSSAFVACVLYHPTKAGCDAMKIFEVSADGVLNEHDVKWSSQGGTVDVVWSPNNFDIAFYSNNTGLWLFNRKGSLINHNYLLDLTYPEWVNSYRFTTIYSVGQPTDPATFDWLPSTLYEISPEALNLTEVYAFANAVVFLGIDSQSKYILLEEISPDRQTSLSIVLFDLLSDTIIRRYPLPASAKINNRAEGSDKIAFDFQDGQGIWVFDFKTKTIEIRKPGMLMGWLPPDKGFLIWDDNSNWKLLNP